MCRILQSIQHPPSDDFQSWVSCTEYDESDASIYKPSRRIISKATIFVVCKFGGNRELNSSQGVCYLDYSTRYCCIAVARISYQVPATAVLVRILGVQQAVSAKAGSFFTRSDKSLLFGVEVRLLAFVHIPAASPSTPSTQHGQFLLFLYITYRTTHCTASGKNQVLQHNGIIMLIRVVQDKSTERRLVASCWGERTVYVKTITTITTSNQGFLVHLNFGSTSSDILIDRPPTSRRL